MADKIPFSALIHKQRKERERTSAHWVGITLHLDTTGGAGKSGWVGGEPKKKSPKKGYTLSVAKG